MLLENINLMFYYCFSYKSREFISEKEQQLTLKKRPWNNLLWVVRNTVPVSENCFQFINWWSWLVWLSWAHQAWGLTWFSHLPSWTKPLSVQCNVTMETCHWFMRGLGVSFGTSISNLFSKESWIICVCVFIYGKTLLLGAGIINFLRDMN